MGDFDKAVVAKVAHWIEFYAEKFTKLEKNFHNLNAQYCLIATLSGIEASIGIPIGYSQEKRIYKFFKNNLNTNEIKEFQESIQFYDEDKGGLESRELKQVCNELVSMRHGLLHRADLINLPPDNISSLGAKGRDIRKLPYYINNKLNPDKLLKFTKIALSHYFNSGKERKPKRMLDKIYPKLV